MHFLGINWHNQTKTPSLIYRDQITDDKINSLLVTAGEKLTVIIGKERFCIGYSESGKKIACKNAGEQISSAQCASCRFKDSTYFLHLDMLRTDQLDILKSKASTNYVNIFGNGITKTGVTAIERKFTRVLEQGSLATIFFTDTNAYNARKIENFVSKTLNIKQAVTWETKLKHLQDLVTNDDAFTKLTDIYQRIVESAGNEYKPALLLKPGVYFNYDYYSLHIPKNLPGINYLEAFNFEDTISGKIIGVFGEIILLEQENGSVLGVNTKNLQGYLLKISRKHLKTHIKNAPELIKFYQKPMENLSLFTT